MSVFSELSRDTLDDDDDSSSDDYSDENIYFDLSKVQGDNYSDTDPQEYEDYVDFEFYTKNIEKKKPSASLEDQNILKTDFCKSSSLEPSVKKPEMPKGPKPDFRLTSFEEDFESKVDVCFLDGACGFGPRGTLKKSEAPNILNLTDIQGEKRNAISLNISFKSLFVSCVLIFQIQNPSLNLLKSFLEGTVNFFSIGHERLYISSETY